VAVARRRARRPPTAADFALTAADLAPAAADLLGWRPPHMSGADLRRTVTKCAEVHAPKRLRMPKLAPNIRQIGAKIAESGL
jgi:hypothetical protein